ncbi:MAG: hypothetical protein ACNA8K_16060 [Cyclonatronaceae bacterium]
MQKIIITSLIIIAFSLIQISELTARQNDDLLYRKVRVTLVPGLSTNGINAYQHDAKYSLNIIAGYHGGLEGYEVGLVNINRKFARGFQLGGLQLAGFANYAGTELSGLQAAGWKGSSFPA